MAVDRNKLLHDIENGAAWDAGVVFNRTNGIPIDKFSIFGSYEEAAEYALNSKVAYPGQVVAVVPESGKATAYIIQTDGNLEEIGATMDLTNYVTQDILTTALDSKLNIDDIKPIPEASIIALFN